MNHFVTFVVLTMFVLLLNAIDPSTIDTETNINGQNEFTYNQKSDPDIRKKYGTILIGFDEGYGGNNGLSAPFGASNNNDQTGYTVTNGPFDGFTPNWG